MLQETIARHLLQICSDELLILLFSIKSCQVAEMEGWREGRIYIVLKCEYRFWNVQVRKVPTDCCIGSWDLLSTQRSYKQRPELLRTSKCRAYLPLQYREFETL